MGNSPEKASTSARISFVFICHFPSFASVSLNSFSVALGLMLACISTVSSIPATKMSHFNKLLLDWRNRRSEVQHMSFVFPSLLPSPLWMYSATFRKSSSRRPLEVRAGVPRRMPLGRRALLSPGFYMTGKSQNF